MSKITYLKQVSKSPKPNKCFDLILKTNLNWKIKLIMEHPVEKKMFNVLVTFEKKRNAFVNDTKNEP